MNTTPKKQEMAISPIGSGKFPWFHNQETEAFLVLKEREACRVRRTTRHTFFLSHPEIKIESRIQQNNPPPWSVAGTNIPAADIRLETAGNLNDAIKMAEEILAPVLEFDTRVLVQNTPWSESTNLSDQSPPSANQLRWLLSKDDLQSEDYSFLTRREARMHITRISSKEAMHRAYGEMPNGIYVGVSLDMLQVYYPKYIQHMIGTWTKSKSDQSENIQAAKAAFDKNPIDWVKNHRRKLFAAALISQEKSLREQWDEGQYLNVRVAMETALQSDPQSPWVAVEQAANMIKTARTKINAEKIMEMAAVEKEPMTKSKLVMLSENNAHLFKPAGEPKTQPRRHMNPEAFQTVIRRSPGWAATLTEEIEIIGFCNMDRSPITHLSEKLIFRGESKPGMKAASFRNCPNLKTAEGTFHGSVSFDNSAIENIGNLTVHETNPNGPVASFRNCQKLQSAKGRFDGSVDFSKSGIHKIERGLSLKEDRSHPTRFDDCPNLNVAEGTFPGTVSFDGSAITSVGYLKIPDQFFAKRASFLRCNNLTWHNIPPFLQRTHKYYQFEPEIVPEPELVAC